MRLIRMIPLIAIILIQLSCAQLNGDTQTWIDDGCLAEEVAENTSICVADNTSLVVKVEW